MKSSVNLNEVMLAVPAATLVEQLAGVKTLEDLYGIEENLTFIETYEGVDCPPLFNPGKGSKLIIMTIDYRIDYGEETQYEIDIRRCRLKMVDFAPLFAKFVIDWRELLTNAHAHLMRDYFPHQVELEVDVVIGDDGTEHLDLCLSVD